ncbi:MAG: hypothetical protein JWM68_4117 [Verrucomicrobiales bacterium]|nr:hypothetical protein [Verrucomicrobiales bacterium]
MRTSLFMRLGLVLAVFIELHAGAGSFFSDFNSGLATNASVFGSATVDKKGGVNGSGVLKLTTAQVSQMGSFVVHSLDGKKPAASFLATFKAYIGGGTGADGFTFLFASNVPDEPFADKTSAGLTLIFDTYKNGSQIAPGIRVKYSKAPMMEMSVPNLRSEHFMDVMVKVDPDGTLDVLYDNDPVFSNVETSLTNVVGRFALGARTGTRVDNHFIDDLRIVTQTSPGAFVDTFLPIGNEVSPLVVIDIVIRDFKTKVKAGSVKLSFDNAAVKPEVSSAADGTTLVHYDPPGVFEPATSHRVDLQFVDTGKPAITNEFSYAFRISSQITISK